MTPRGSGGSGALVRDWALRRPRPPARFAARSVPDPAPWRWFVPRSGRGGPGRCPATPPDGPPVAGPSCPAPRRSAARALGPSSAGASLFPASSLRRAAGPVPGPVGGRPVRLVGCGSVSCGNLLLPYPVGLAGLAGPPPRSPGGVAAVEEGAVSTLVSGLRILVRPGLAEAERPTAPPAGRVAGARPGAGWPPSEGALDRPRGSARSLPPRPPATPPGRGDRGGEGRPRPLPPAPTRRRPSPLPLPLGAEPPRPGAGDRACPMGRALVPRSSVPSLPFPLGPVRGIGPLPPGSPAGRPPPRSIPSRPVGCAGPVVREGCRQPPRPAPRGTSRAGSSDGVGARAN